MHKDEAMRRLDAIENEARELRKIIEGKSPKYDDCKLYVGINGGLPYILVGYDRKDYFRFHSFGAGPKSEHGYSEPNKTGQECLDYHINAGFDLHEFTSTREALQFFLDNLKE